MASELLKRSEVKVEDTWKIEDMYASIEDWEKDLKKCEDIVNDICKLEGTLGTNGENLKKLLDLYVAFDQTLSLAFNYAERVYDVDTTNTKSQELSAKVFTVYSSLSEKLAFISPEILAIDTATLEKYFKEVEGLEFYRNYIEVEITRLKDHTLSKEMETLLAQTAEMSRTATDVYGILNNADITFPETTDEEGNQVRLTHGRFIPLLESANREVRKEAFEKYYSSYISLASTYAAIYNGQVKQQYFHAKARNYDSSLVAAVDANNVSPVVYKNLCNVVNKNLKNLHRYVGIRKKLLGVDELHMYDIYTPMVAGVAKKVPFKEAEETILKALAPLGQDYLDKLNEGFNNRWIDVYENVGKRSGAYSAGAYGTHPYVLMNYNESLDNMFTLAHEMGHALHSYYSNQTQAYIYSQYKIFVAEVASTTNEVLLLEYLLQNTEDKATKMYLLNHYLDMFKGTLYRQTQFAEFELRTNEMVERGESLNKENLCSLYKEINANYYGPEMIQDDEISYEWARIPHFYYNFYVYQYATSFSAAVAIAHEILEKGEPMVKKYKEFLSGGCSKSPVDLLKICGIDMEKEEPIQMALDAMSKVLDQMEELTK